MRNRFAIVFVFVFGVCAWAQRSDTLLNDQWRFIRSDISGAQQPGFDDSAWATVDVPHTYNAYDTQDGGSYYRGPAWYRRTLAVPAADSGRRLYLYFESVGKAADVYCNGTFVGRHEGAYASFCFDITDRVMFGADNLIAVRADNSGTGTLNIIPRSGDFNQYGGICRSVRLITTDPVHITPLDYASPGVYLTQTNVSETSADLAIRTLVRNAGVAGKLVTVKCRIYDADNGLIENLQNTHSVAGNSTQPILQFVQINAPRLWNGRVDPYLYRVVVDIEVGGLVVDTVEQPLGLRYYSVDPDNGFFLNGQYLDLRGVAIHEDRLNKGRAISDADRTQDIALMLEMGCTWIRLSHYQHAEIIYDLADQYGIVLSTEIPIVDSITFDTAFVENCKEQLRELIRQNYNHPSVCFWLLYNELTTSGSETVIQQLHALAKTEDPTRPTSCAHNNTSDTAAWSYVADTLGYNRYMGWYGSSPEGFAPWADSIHAQRPDDAIGIMEYGAGANPAQHETPPAYPGPTSPWHPEEYQCHYHEVYWKAMKARPFLWCKTIWNGFDFAVDWRNEGSQIALNDKGMVTRDRAVKKDVFYWYQANWTTEPMVYITSRRFTPRHNCPPYVKVYSNCETVELFINGRSMGARPGSDCIFLWDQAIQLNLGDNEIRAVGRSGGNEYTDTCTWQFEIENKLPVAAVTASHYETANPPQNAADGSLGTRWAGDNYPWIEFDLGAVRTVEQVGIAFFKGNERTYTFDIEVSTDGTNWTPVLTGARSGGATSDIETFDLGTVEARWVRINGQGNTGPYPAWSSYHEVEFYTNLSPDCAFMRSLNCGYAADFTGFNGEPDCYVNQADLALLAGQWLEDYRQHIVPTEPPAEHLAAHWPLDGSYADVTGNGYDAVPGTSPVFDAGRLGQSVCFDGAADVSYLACQNSAGLHLDGGAAVCAWIKTGGLVDEWASVVTKGVSSWRLIRNGNSGSLAFHVNAAGGGEYQANGTAAVTDNQWHHVAGIYDGGEVRLYVDGRLDAREAAGPVSTSGDPVYIGSRINNTANRNWIGHLDDVRIYDAPLSEANVLFLAEGAAYYQLPDPPRPTDLVIDGQIDLDDLARFLHQWLWCNDPQDPLCGM